MRAVGRSGGTSDAIAFIAASALLVGALVFGGGPRGAGDAVVHLLAAPALLLAVWRWRPASATGVQRAFVCWLIAVVMLLAAHLAPLPAGVFAELPQRANVLDALRDVDAAPRWLPMTLDVWATVRAGLAFVTFAAMALLALTLSSVQRRRLLQLALALAVPMALLGFAQAAGGEHAPRWYAFHHPMGAIGLFANRNHYAALMDMLLPFALAFAVEAQEQRDISRSIAWYGVAVMLLLAAALSFSRAGGVLALLGLAASLLWLRPHRAGHARLLPAVALGLAALGVATYAWSGIVHRFTVDPVDDLRWQYLHYGAQAARAYLPWGSGLGSFRWAYAPFEPIAALTSTYADRAHDELLQLLIEGGVPAALLLVAFSILTVISVAKLMRTRPVLGENRVTMKAASVAVVLPLLHSLVDYPLRTHAVAVTWALALALLLSGSGSGKPAGRVGDSTG